ncbi:hypothetical protein D3C79_996760 [compost metagenome]
MGDLLIHPVNREHILHQIVGADTEKVHFLRQQIRDHNGSRNFNHDADWYFAVIRNLLLVQFLLHFI